mgnify:CR=1 FL=1
MTILNLLLMIISLTLLQLGGALNLYDWEMDSFNAYDGEALVVSNELIDPGYFYLIPPHHPTGKSNESTTSFTPPPQQS